MRLINRINTSYLLMGCFVLLGLAANYCNQRFYHYPGNNYIFEDLFWIVSFYLFMLYLGCQYTFGKYSQVSLVFFELLVGLLFFNLLFWGATQIQFTPFSPIDRWLVKADAWVQVDIGKSVTWLHSHDIVRRGLDNIYYGMCVVIFFSNLFIILSRKKTILNQYYQCMLFSTLLGYAIYYFFPTTAPASNVHSPYFGVDQIATGLKFNQLHHHTEPTTSEGGMISFPSFHVIWTWFSVYMLRGWPWVFMVMLIYWVSLSTACMLLGWHYFMDILGSVFIIGLTHWFERQMR